MSFSPDSQAWTFIPIPALPPLPQLGAPWSPVLPLNSGAQWAWQALVSSSKGFLDIHWCFHSVSSKWRFEFQIQTFMCTPCLTLKKAVIYSAPTVCQDFICIFYLILT